METTRSFISKSCPDSTPNRIRTSLQTTLYPDHGYDTQCAMLLYFSRHHYSQWHPIKVVWKGRTQPTIRESRVRTRNQIPTALHRQYWFWRLIIAMPCEMMLLSCCAVGFSIKLRSMSFCISDWWVYCSREAGLSSAVHAIHHCSSLVIFIANVDIETWLNVVAAVLPSWSGLSQHGTPCLKSPGL